MIDLITGDPLYQEIDFELPFGGAVFRHVRTHATQAAARTRIGALLADDHDDPYHFTYNPHDWFWDWNGRYWMMGENPILLVDAKYGSIDCDSQICYFIPDAHHLVPFRKVPDSGGFHYSAPDHVDARMVMQEENGDTYYEVWMHRGSIKYTFKCYQEDIWEYESDEDMISAHDPNELGYPYYAMIDSIQDRYGNKVRYHYCDFSQYGGPDCDVPGTDCSECCQNCNRKGQIVAVELISGAGTGEGSVVWTLLYTHREFATVAFPGHDYDDPAGMPNHISCDGNPLMFGTMLHSIHVYEGELSSIPECLLLDHVHFASLDSFDDYDLINEENPDVLDLPDDWKMRVRYMYDEPGTRRYTALEADRPYRIAYNINAVCGDVGCALLKASVSRRESSDAAPETTHTIYRYTPRYWAVPFSAESQGAINEPELCLNYIFSDSTINTILENYSPGEDGVTENILFETSENDLVTVPDGSGGVVQKELRDVADLVMRPWRHGTGQEDQNTWNTVAPLAEDLGLDALRAIHHAGGTKEFVDRRDGSTRYEITQLRIYPPRVPAFDLNYNSWDWYMDPNVMVTGALDWPQYHWPYRFFEPPFWDDQAQNNRWVLAEPNHAEDGVHGFYVTVIKEYDWECTTEPDPYDPEAPPIEDCEEVLRNRRCVEMNLAGFIVRDRRWTYHRDGDTEYSQFGFGEEYVYDDLGRKIERRTRGWSIANDPNTTEEPATDGLIYVYEYEIPCAKSELKSIGIKKGTDSPAYLLRSYDHHEDRPELVTHEVSYPNPDEASGPIVEVYRDYEFGEGDDPPIMYEAVVSTAGPRTLDGGEAYHAKLKKYDGTGNLTWWGAGTFDGFNEETGLGAALEFYSNHAEHDDQGRKTLEVIDPNEAEYPPPSQFQRESELEPPLNLETIYTYETPYGLKTVVYPNERETHIYYKQQGNTLRQWIYKDVIPEGDSCGLLSPIMMNEFVGAQLVTKYEIGLDSTAYPPEGETDWEEFVISTTTPEHDANGRIIGINRSGGDGETISANIDYHYTGQPSRQEEPDGTITRHVYDELSRLERTYRGTSDLHPYWRTADPNAPLDDDMMLIEKRYYGTGVNDVNELVRVRHYREKPDNQYCEEAEEGGPWIPPNNEDGIGWATEHEYDWRMREVWVQRRAEDIPPQNPEDPGVVGEPLTHTLTWYDNLNRARFVAGYCDTAPEEAGVDPRAAAPGAAEPTAGDILSTSVAPLSLTENIYNKAGQIEEVRRYAIDPNSPDPDPDEFTSTITFYNHRGQPLEVHAPNSPVRTYAYDAKGRQVRSSSLASGLEMTRTETQYDDNDRAIVTVHYERLDGAGGNLEDYCVRTYTHTWYDDAGKVIATANYGTNNDTFSNGDAPVYNPDPDQIPNGSGGELVTWYVYDEAGRQSEVTHPDNTKTTYEYDGLGRLLMTIENADGVGDEARRTAYEYDPNTAQLIRMAAVLQDVNSHDVIDWNSDIQITEFVYGAEVVDNDGTGISYNNGWIDEVHFPDRLTGQPDSSQLLKFTYYSDGSVASREDARGIVFEHVYDELGRRITTTVDDYAWYGAMDPNMVPPNRITQIDYEYQADGMLALVTAWADDPGDPGSSIVVAQNEFTYDGADNLLAEWQQHFGTVDGDSAVINYTWDFRSAIDASGEYDPNGNYNRPVDMTYPTRGESEVAVEFSYGDGSGDVDHALSRITEISADYDGAEYWVQYRYAGLGRRVTREYGNSGVIQSFGDGEGYPGLDRFGRVIDLHFQKPSAGQPDRAQYQYGYDKAGNRTHVRTWQPALGDPNGHDNDRSYAYEYDDLNRLIAADLGSLNGTNDAIEDSPVPWRTDWLLDNLGNWSGGDAASASLIEIGDFDFDGQADPDRTTHHATNHANEIDAIDLDGGSGGGGETITFVHDAVGNLVFDGVYWYQYDGWNRLVQVNDAGTLTDADFDADTGFLIPPDPNDPNDPDGVPGDPVARFVYDGLGRLIFCSTHLDYSEPIDEHVNRHLYYDGVRRVSEQRHTRLWGYPIVDRWDQLDYVWGPDYVDELALVIHREGGVRYAIQDANYNLVAWLKAGSVVAAQYTYGPYGELRAADLRPTESEWPSMGVGHQGLFFIRFDGDPDDPPHAVGARGLYYNRNRWYSPDLGRFIQRDVNETALPIITALAFNGETLDALLGAFDGQGLYGDGMNLYLYAGANPVGFGDPLGLVYDPFEDVDDWIEDRISNALYTLGHMNQAALGLTTALHVTSALLGIDVFADVIVLATGRGGFWEAMNIVASMNPIGRAAKVGRILGGTFKWMRRGARAGDAAVGAFKAFKQGNFRYNLKVLTRFEAPTKIHAHHMLPVRQGPDFRRAGINIHDPKWGAWWEGTSHLNNRVRYDNAWVDFFKKHPNPAVGAIEAEARRLASDFGLAINF